MKSECQHCGKSLYEALRQGCRESPCGSFSLGFEGPYLDPFDFSKDDEMKRETGLDRFSPVFTGFQWFVVDKLGKWYPMNDKNHAEDRAKAWSYEHDAMC